MGTAAKPTVYDVDELLEFVDLDGLPKKDFINLVESLIDDGSMSLRAVLKKESDPLTSKQCGSAYLLHEERFYALQFQDHVKWSVLHVIRADDLS